jgi:hypothetical protein
MPEERVPPGQKPYDWAKRREGVMRRFKNVRNWVMPFGSAEPFRPTGEQGDPKRELAWLMKTQFMEIPPMWEELAANGLAATSRNGIGDETPDADVEPDQTDYTSALAETYEHARAERWARERDYQTWMSSQVRKCRIIENDDGTRTIRANYGHEWDIEELRAILRRPPSEPNTEPWDEYRHDFEIEDQEARMEPEAYMNAEECPMYREYFQSRRWCDNGKAPVFQEMESGGYAYAGEGTCPVCNGTGVILSTLGIALSIVPDED